MSTMTAPPPREQLPALAAPRLPYHPAFEERYGIDKSGWRVLVDAVYPNATSAESVLLAVAYCKSRGLDPFKRCVHIVPIWSKAEKRMVDSIWPGIGEVRTTAHRTGGYAGHEPTVFGPDVHMKVGSLELTFPEFAQITVYRMVQGVRCPFPGPKVLWLESYATAGRDKEEPNEMWAGRPYGQIEKCAEAAALRAAFPEEIGHDFIPEEVEGRTFAPGSIIDIKGMTVPHQEPPTKVRRSTLNDIGKAAVPSAGPTSTDEPPPAGPPPVESPPAEDLRAAEAMAAEGGHPEQAAFEQQAPPPREPGDDEQVPQDDTPLSDAALALEAKLHDANLDRKRNAALMQEISAGRFTQDERQHLNKIAKENAARFKGKAT